MTTRRLRAEPSSSQRPLRQRRSWCISAPIHSELGSPALLVTMAPVTPPSLGDSSSAWMRNGGHVSANWRSIPVELGPCWMGGADFHPVVAPRRLGALARTRQGRGNLTRHGAPGRNLDQGAREPPDDHGKPRVAQDRGRHGLYPDNPLPARTRWPSAARMTIGGPALGFLLIISIDIIPSFSHTAPASLQG